MSELYENQPIRQETVTTSATITFKDGAELVTEQNGSCFIVDEEPTFPADLSEVTIVSRETRTIYPDEDGGENQEEVSDEDDSVEGKNQEEVSDEEETPAEPTVIVTEETHVLHDASVQECASVDGRYWFTFTTESEGEKTIRELQEVNDMLTECILEMSEILYA